MKAFKVGLALGGGGARGFAHLGVLRVLEKEEIPIDMIAGTSFGAIIGGLYAQQPDAELVIAKVKEFLESPRFRRARVFFLKKHYQEEKGTGFIQSLKTYLKRGIFFGISLQKESFIKEQDFVESINGLLEEKGIESCLLPFYAVATELVEGTEVILDSGPIRKAVAASCAIPGIFPPIRLNGSQLVDGGWVNAIPVEPLFRRGADLVIAIDTSEENVTIRSFANGLEIALRADDIARRILSRMQADKADVLIQPDIGNLHWSHFDRMEEGIARGEEATRLKIDQIKRLVWKKKMKKLLLINV